MIWWKGKIFMSPLERYDSIDYLLILSSTCLAAMINWLFSSDAWIYLVFWSTSGLDKSKILCMTKFQKLYIFVDIFIQKKLAQIY